MKLYDKHFSSMEVNPGFFQYLSSTRLLLYQVKTSNWKFGFRCLREISLNKTMSVCLLLEKKSSREFFVKFAYKEYNLTWNKMLDSGTNNNFYIYFKVFCQLKKFVFIVFFATEIIIGELLCFGLAKNKE